MRRPLTIALLSFDRPDYLRRVLSARSVGGELIPGDEIFLFQDGGSNPFSGNRKASESAIDARVRVFSSPRRLETVERRVFRSPINLGVAGNYRRAEQYIFEALGRDAAVLLEDDLVLGPHYLEAIADLLAIGAEEPSIGLCLGLWRPLGAAQGAAETG